MEFELTQETLDQIIFAMEDQTEVSVVDRASGEVIAVRGEAERYSGDRYAPLPEWKPVDGYQLMERFVTGLRNPVLREQLREALAAGRGVFRSFKQALRKSPEVEKRWYLFKEREMRRVVYEWYNEMRELQGLERLSLEPLEETMEAGELITSDFVFTPPAPEQLESLASVDRTAFFETHGELGGERAEALYCRRMEKYATMSSPDSLTLVAEDLGGQLGGFAWGVRRPTRLASGDTWKIVQLYVSPTFRGIGLGGALLRRLLGALSERGAGTVLVDLGTSAMAVSELFEREGFAPVAQLLGLDMSTWAAEEEGAPA